MMDSSGLDNSLNTADRFWQIDKDGPGGTAHTHIYHHTRRNGQHPVRD